MVNAQPAVRGPWPGLTLAGGAALALCAAIGWLLLDQRAVLTQALAGLERFRRARVDLANGMLHHALAAGPEMPYDRAQGAALLIQGVAEVQESIHSTDDHGLADARDLVAPFRACADRFLAELAAFPAVAPRDGPAEARLRLTFHDLERAADQFDRRRRAGLRTLVERLDRNLVVTGSVAAGLLLAIAGAALLIARAHVRSIAALRASEDRLRTVIDNLVEGVTIADANGHYLQWNRSASDLLGFTAGDRPDNVEALRARFELLDTNGAVLPFGAWPIPRLLRGDEVRQVELVVRRRRDGHERTMLCSGAIATDAAGDRLGACRSPTSAIAGAPSTSCVPRKTGSIA